MNITDLLSIIFSIIGVVVALVIYLRQKKDGTIKYLANQIRMFYDEEQMLIKEISDRRKQLSITPDNEKTILREFRKKVESQGCKISETSTTVKRFF